ncbi:DUF58 domain-containing protein [Halomicrobium salinisoli]|uniref:DUF58 domain-containing protein n=1 Tax=Halomicrobium salinisoli TaxID=2878391 RepID=UPI001CF02BA6|nr:DUF58 domain-containing protein [Halomicrobium salinisoli]
MIDPGFLDELDRFEASLAHRTDDRLRGEHRSSAVGEGLTFSDYRNYVPGDDTRLVDWKLYARTGELYVKQFEAERNLTVHVLLDSSASMDVGDGDAHKFEYAAKLGLGYAALAAADHADFRVSLLGERFERIDAGRSDRGEVLALVDRCNETDPEGAVDFERVLADYAATIDSRSLVLVASDFLDDPDSIEAGLDALAGNHLVLAHVVAPRERDPPVSGDVVFEALERSETLRTYFGSKRRRTYRERLRDHVADVEERAERTRARHERVDTDRPFFEAFADVWV